MEGAKVRDGAWEDVARNILRAEMTRRGLSYARVADALWRLGVLESEANVRNKIGRGRFTAIFFLQCMSAIGADWLRVPTPVEIETLAANGRGIERIDRRPDSGPPE